MKTILMIIEYLISKLFEDRWNGRICWTVLGVTGVWMCFVVGTLMCRTIFDNLIK
jgi:hypothetical protein